MRTAPKQVYAFAEEYAETYTALVQCEAVNKILMEERDDLKARLLVVTQELDFAQEGNIYVGGLNFTAPEDRPK